MCQKGQLRLDGEKTLLQIVVQNLGDALALLLLCHGQLRGECTDLLLGLDALCDIGRDDGDPTGVIC